MKNLKAKSPTIVDLPFDEQLTRRQVSQIVIELIKATIFHRNQIPMTIETLRREINEFHQEETGGNEVEMSEEEDFCRRRIRMRQRNAKIRKQKLRSKFVKLSEKFLSQYEILEKLVSEVLLEDSNQQEVKEIAFTLGLTSGAPKEVYIVHLPDAYGKELGVVLDRRKVIRIFRSVMYEFEVLGSECSMTNMFLAFKIDSAKDPVSDQLVPKDFENWPQRSNVTHFFFKVANEPKKRAHVTGTDSYTPSAMQLCTPYATDKQWQRKRYASEDSSTSDQMIETPIQKTNLVSRMTGDDCNEVEESVDKSRWFYCNSVLKGFRDPQVKRE